MDQMSSLFHATTPGDTSAQRRPEPCLLLLPGLFVVGELEVPQGMRLKDFLCTARSGLVPVLNPRSTGLQTIDSTAYLKLAEVPLIVHFGEAGRADPSEFTLKEARAVSLTLAPGWTATGDIFLTPAQSVSALVAPSNDPFLPMARPSLRDAGGDDLVPLSVGTFTAFVNRGFITAVLSR
jgi:hypothetical protein